MAFSQLVLATHNPGKVRELDALLRPYGVEISSAADHQVPEPEETGTTFAENAALKAHHTAQATGLPALADDSGLAVDALAGAPGIYSARWGGVHKDFALAMERVQQELQSKGMDPEGANAHFICHLTLALPDGSQEDFEGTIHGTLTFPPRGDKGFGYDPIFIAKGHDLTFAEIEPDKKHAISHRADAFAKFIKYYQFTCE